MYIKDIVNELFFQGYCLLYETMLPSVLVARDKWLKKVMGQNLYIAITEVSVANNT